jgi:hypothetical protein
MTTAHAYTFSQAIVSTQSRPKRSGRRRELRPHVHRRSAATAKALPEYHGRFDGVGRPGAPPCRFARGHRRRRRQTDDGG